MPEKGIWTAIVSPFQTNASLDLEAFKRLVQRQIDAGVQGVIPCGTTGESPTLSKSEKMELIETTVDLCKNTPTQVYAGTGSNNTQETIEFSKWASQAGVDGLLVVTPYYNKPSQSGLLKHYLSLSDSVDCPIMLYQVPGRTGISFQLETLLKLAERDNITSLKEASSDVSLVKTLINALKEKNLSLQILSGDDPTYLDYIKEGASGVVSVASNLIPKQMVNVYQLFQSGNIAEAEKLNSQYKNLYRDLFIESNPTPVKQSLAEMDLCLSKVRLPLDEMQNKNKEVLIASLKETGLLGAKHD